MKKILLLLFTILITAGCSERINFVDTYRVESISTCDCGAWIYTCSEISGVGTYSGDVDFHYLPNVYKIGDSIKLNK